MIGNYHYDTKKRTTEKMTKKKKQGPRKQEIGLNKLRTRTGSRVGLSKLEFAEVLICQSNNPLFEGSRRGRNGSVTTTSSINEERGEGRHLSVRFL